MFPTQGSTIMTALEFYKTPCVKTIENSWPRVMYVCMYVRMYVYVPSSTRGAESIKGRSLAFLFCEGS